MSALNEDPNFLPEDYDDNPDNEEDEGGHKKRKQVKRACFACRKAHARCDEERPCRRCIRTGCEATCVDVPRKKRVLAKRPEDMPKKSPAVKPQRGRPRRRLDESGEGCESGGENDSKNFYFDAAEDEVLEGGSIGGKTTPAHAHHHSLSTSTGSTATLPSTKKFEFSSSSSLSSSSTSPSTSDIKVSWKDSLLDSMAFAHSDDDSKESVSSSNSGRQRDEEPEFSFDLGKSSDDERCLEEIPQEMVRELTELRSYNSTLQDMIKDVQQFNSYQRKKRRQWELNKINSGNGGSTTAATVSGTTAATTTATLATAAPSDALPQWLVSDFSSLSNKMVDLSSDVHSSSSSSSSTSSSHTQRSEEGEMDYIGAWQAMTAAAQQTSHAPLHLPAQLAQLAGQPLQFSAMHLNSGQTSQQQQQGSAPATGPAPFTTSLPFTEV